MQALCGLSLTDLETVSQKQVFTILQSVQNKLRVRHYNRRHTWAHERKIEALQRLRSGVCPVGGGGMVNEVMRNDEFDGGGTVELDANHELDESEGMKIPASLINILMTTGAIQFQIAACWNLGKKLGRKRLLEVIGTLS